MLVHGGTNMSKRKRETETDGAGAAAVDKKNKVNEPCKFVASAGGCRAGVACRFSHDADAAKTPETTGRPARLPCDVQIKIDDTCMETFPCQHNVTVLLNGKAVKRDLALYSTDVAKLFDTLGIRSLLPEHLKDGDGASAE